MNINTHELINFLLQQEQVKNLTSQLLGHNDIKMTQIYLDINFDDHKIKNDLYNPLSNLTH